MVMPFHDGLIVHTQSHDYPIVITEQSATEHSSMAKQITPYISGRQVLIVTNDTVAPLYLKALEDELAEQLW